MTHNRRPVAFYRRENKLGKMTTRPVFGNDFTQGWPTVLSSSVRTPAVFTRQNGSDNGHHHYRVLHFQNDGEISEIGQYHSLSDAEAKAQELTRNSGGDTIILRNPIRARLVAIARRLGQARAFTQELRRGFASGRIQALVEEAQSADASKRVIARRQLRREYPDIFISLFTRGASPFPTVDTHVPSVRQKDPFGA